jgi:hypothetical protein
MRNKPTRRRPSTRLRREVCLETTLREMIPLFLSGRASLDTRERIDYHLRHCNSCAALVMTELAREP